MLSGCIASSRTINVSILPVLAIWRACFRNCCTSALLYVIVPSLPLRNLTLLHGAKRCYLADHIYIFEVTLLDSFFFFSFFFFFTCKNKFVIRYKHKFCRYYITLD
ncbi:hypothetical protein PUN28_016053 [Cardiocondyla obscurior]|uniref:Uncharacterized protein n=1 Tax=Cardiocondyla obscurior TaxID=286306 RepID=A0AAW2ESF3_9HYME